MRLHHVQVSCPPGGEADARQFYAGGLGLTEVGKPAALADRGGVWFRSHDSTGSIVAEIHVGIEDPFQPARRAHAALVVNGATELEAAAERLTDAGFEVDWRERHTFDGYERFHTFDAAGNRVEILSPVGGAPR